MLFFREFSAAYMDLLLNIYSRELQFSMKDITQSVFSVLPTLTKNSKKGDNGNIGIIGGSYEYTGAPYYAAISALKVGADLVHIFCSKSAAVPIKTYSPEIIVHPLFVTSEEIDQELDEGQIEEMQKKWVKSIQKFYGRINAWVIGPGLGRDPYIGGFFKLLIQSLPQKTLTILDADALYFTCQYPTTLHKLSTLQTIMTPNHRQFHHLNKILNLPAQQLNKQFSQYFSSSKNYNQKLMNKIWLLEQQQQSETKYRIIKKGEIDVIMTKKYRYAVRAEGSLKRCGGIGDILAGTVAVCCHWDSELGCLLACYIAKLAAKLAYEKQGRSLTAPMIIQQLPETIKRIQSKIIKPLF